MFAEHPLCQAQSGALRPTAGNEADKTFLDPTFLWGDKKYSRGEKKTADSDKRYG